MASYSYGGLLVRVTGDTKPLTQQVDQAAKTAGDKAARTLSDQITRGLGRAAGGIGRGVATGLGSAAIAATAFGVQAFKAAARVGEMDAALKALAKSNNVSYAAMQQQVSAIRRQGIEAGVAQKTVAEFTKGHMQLSKATTLARVAQDAAVISGKNSTQVLDDLIHGIVTQNTEVLRNAGVNVMASTAEQAFAKARGKSVVALTAQEKQTAVLNAVLAQGQTVAGAYAAAMEEPGKVLRSFPRLINDIQVSVGQGLLKAFGPVIIAAYKFGKALDAAIAPGGRLAPIFDQVGTSAAALVSPVTHVINLATKLLTTLDPAKVKPVIDTIARFAPAFASIGAAAATFAGKNLLGDLPVIGKVLGGIGGPLGVVVTGLATLALTSPQARAALSQLAGVLTAGLAPVLAELTPIIGQLGQSLAVLLAAGLRALIPLVPPLVRVLEAALAVIIALLPVITWLTDVLARFAPEIMAVAGAWYALTVAVRIYNAVAAFNVIVQARQLAATITYNAELLVLRVQLAALALWTGIVRVATIAWTAAQWLLNAALDANPIGLVVVALAALGAALYLAWTRSATFRDIVIGAWRAVLSVVMPVLSTLASVIVGTFNVIRTVVVTVCDFVRRYWAMMLVGLLIIAVGGLPAIIIVIVRHWAEVKAAFAAGFQFVLNVAKQAYGLLIQLQAVFLNTLHVAWSNWINGITGSWRSFWAAMTAIGKGALQLLSTIVNGALAGIKALFSLNFGQIATNVRNAWNGMVRDATNAGGSIIGGLKAGITSAVSGIAGWVKKSIVDPIVNAVKTFFGIHSPSTVMQAIGGNLIKGLFLGIVPGIHGVGNLVQSVFGTFPGALAAMIGHGLVGIASLPGKAINAIMGLFGGGGNAGALAATAAKYNGHRYVWGGGSNPTTGFDCSSFVNMLHGMLGLGIPGGFHAPSAQHGPVASMWRLFSQMGTVPYSAMQMNDVFASDTHVGVVTGPGRGFAARSTATGTGPQPVGSGYTIKRHPGKGLKLPGWLQGVMGKISGLFGHLFGGSGGSDPGRATAGVDQWRGLALQVLNMFGLPQFVGSLLAQMQTESGGNVRAQNNWDINARNGVPSKGLMQVIDPTFAAYSGPFRGRGIWDPLANIYAAVAYAISRYGRNLAAVWGHGHGYAMGGVIGEHVIGFGQSSGDIYHIGEAGPELVSPLTGGSSLAGLGRGAGPVIHVHPSAGMDERALAAMVSRELAWAAAGGYPE